MVRVSVVMFTSTGMEDGGRYPYHCTRTGDSIEKVLLDLCKEWNVPMRDMLSISKIELNIPPNNPPSISGNFLSDHGHSDNSFKI